MEGHFQAWKLDSIHILKHAHHFKNGGQNEWWAQKILDIPRPKSVDLSKSRSKSKIRSIKFTNIQYIGNLIYILHRRLFL